MTRARIALGRHPFRPNLSPRRKPLNQGVSTRADGLDLRCPSPYALGMRRARRRVAIGALAVSLMVGAWVAAPASGAIKVTRDSRTNVLAQFKDVNCRLQGLEKPLVFL